MGAAGPKVNGKFFYLHTECQGNRKFSPKVFPDLSITVSDRLLKLTLAKYPENQRLSKHNFPKEDSNSDKKESSLFGPPANRFEFSCVFLRYFCFTQVLHPSDLIPSKLFWCKIYVMSAVSKCEKTRQLLALDFDVFEKHTDFHLP